MKKQIDEIKHFSYPMPNNIEYFVEGISNTRLLIILIIFEKCFSSHLASIA
jgi:hypothetical protein